MGEREMTDLHRTTDDMNKTQEIKLSLRPHDCICGKPCFTMKFKEMEEAFVVPMQQLASKNATLEGHLNHALYLLGSFTGCHRPSPDEINVRPSETVTKLKEPEIEMIYKLYESVDRIKRES